LLSSGNSVASAARGKNENGLAPIAWCQAVS
jgi:hypothetical protein